MSSAAKWLEKSLGATVSEFGAQVAALLDDLYFGIYHLPEKSLRKIDWSDPHYIRVCVPEGLSTFDTDGLTRLVILCHDRCIRCEVHPAGPRRLALSFTMRKGREGNFWERHPTLESAMGRVRSGTPGK